VNVLSVDLGTSNTVAVLSAHGRPPRVVDVDGASMMPSAVFAAEDGNLVVGRDAERRARLDPARFEPNPKRRVDEGTLLLGDTVVPVTDALAGVLRRVVDETSRQLGGAKPDEVRLTHPAQWGPVRRNVLLSAARQAGMGSNLVLVPEPVAAAAHFASFPGQTLAPGQALAVYDLGAGTFDVAIVGATQNGFVVLAEAGLPDLGGLDVDQALLEHVGRQVSHREPGRWQSLLRPVSTGDRRAQRALREDVKAAKESLSRHPQTEVPLPEPFEDVLVTRVELEALIRPGMLRSVELLAGTIRSTGMTPDRLVGIYLVGGSSRIPLVATLIAEQLRVVPTSLDQPETAVALGAHHVPKEGVTMRTADMASTLEGARSGLGTPPRTGGFAAGVPSAPVPAQGPQSNPMPAQAPPPTQATPAQSAYPNSGPQHVQGPPSTPTPAAAYSAPATTTSGGSSGSSNKPWYIAAALVGVIVIAVVSVIIATSGDDTNPRTGGQTTAGGDPTGGGDTTGGGDSGSDCSDTEADSSGLSPCMRDLAGAVAENNECEPGAIEPVTGEETPAPGATAATCKLASQTAVIYFHFSDESAVDAFTSSFYGSFTPGEDPETGTWDGDGYSGDYSVGTNSGVYSALIFHPEGSPLMGLLMSADRPDDLPEYFEQSVKPGGDGMAP
jgi:Hsp70 protein